MSDRTLIQTKMAAPTLAEMNSGVLQRKCDCGNHTVAGGECAECGKERNNLQRKTNNQSVPGVSLSLPGISVMQPKLTIGTSNDPLEQEADRIAERVMATQAHPGISGAPLRIQRFSGQSNGHMDMVPASVDRVLANSGRPLEPGLRQDMEQRFGYDFSRVRVHSGAAAEQSTQDVSAHAYTVGNNLVFAQGQYQPHTAAGRKLLAHELTHTLQQSGGAPLVQRSRCGHDGQETRCRGEFGVLKLRDESGKVGQRISIDRWIVADGLRHHFGGQWAAEVMTPPNPNKKDPGEDRARADAVRVNDAGILAIDIAEIKARSARGGGCTLATSDARGYKNVLELIKPQVLTLSAGLAKQGGVRAPKGCRSPKATERAKLEAAGVDFGNETSMQAWCFIHSLQERLNKTYTQAFSDMTVGLFADGDPKASYPVWPPLRIDCPSRKGKKRPGTSFLEFQVNNKGGVSYGCRDECYDSEDEEERHRKEHRVEDEIRKRKTTAPRQTVPSEMYVDNPEQDDIGENEAPIDLPEGGVSVTEVLEVSGTALITVATLHQAAKVLKGRELEAARAAAAKVLAEARAKGAIDLARMNSERLAKQFGTEAYDKTVTSMATNVEKQALKDAGFLAKHGAKGAKFLGRAAGILGVLMLAKDAAAAVSHISKGGTIDIGLQGMDASLEGKTDINTSGLPGKQDVLGDVKLTDTQIDIETKGFPSVSGNVNLQADKLTVRGRAGDGDAKINFTAKYKNTTITIRRDGQIKGGKLTMQGGSEISDADIELDLPPGVDLSKPRDPATSIVIKGGKIKITEVGSGGGGTGKAGTSGGSPGAGTDVEPKADDNPASGAVQIPEPPGKDSARGQSGGTAKRAAAPDIAELVQEVQAHDGLRTLYAGLLGKDDGVPVTAEMLRRLVDLKTTFDRHPGVVQEIIAGLKPAEITDPIKQIIEPIEERMRQADQKLAKAREKAIADALAKVGQSAKPGATTTPVQKPAAQQNKPDADAKASGEKPDKGGKGDKKDESVGSGIDPASVRELRLNDLLPVLERPRQSSTDKTPPKTMDYVLVWRVSVDKSELVYNILAKLTFLQSETAQPGERWRASYTFTPPTGVILNTQGDMPIRFTDTGVITAQVVTTSPAK